MTDNPWFVLYGGTSVDGKGEGNYCGRTTDVKVAKAHWEKCRGDPYSVGSVWVITDVWNRRINYDYEWEYFTANC